MPGKVGSGYEPSMGEDVERLIVDITSSLYDELVEASQLREVPVREIVDAALRRQLSELNDTTRLTKALDESADLFRRDYDVLRHLTEELIPLSPAQAAWLYSYRFIDDNDRVKVFKALRLEDALDEIEQLEAFFDKAKMYQETSLSREWKGEYNLEVLRTLYHKEGGFPLTRAQEEYAKQFLGGE